MGTLNARSSIAACWAASLLALAGCANPTGGTSGGPRPGQVGLAHIQLNVDPSALTSDVEYEITGNGILRVKGVMEAIPGTKAIGVIVNLPAGNGYTIRVNTTVSMLVSPAEKPGTSTPSRALQTCTASAMFDVSSAQPTALPLTLQCEELGSAAQDGGSNKDAGAGPRDDAGRLVSMHLPAALDAGPVRAPGAEAGAVGPASDAGVPSGPVETCDACSVRLCAMVRNISREQDCYQVQGKVVNGPAMGAPRSGVCSAFMKCAHKTGCAAKDARDCYCGVGISPESCLEHGPVGACRAEFEAAGEEWDAAELTPESLQMRYTVLTAALPILSCEAARCAASCFANAK